MYIAPFSGHSLLTLILPLKVILRKFEVVFHVSIDNAALFKQVMKIHSNLPMLYYGFKEEIHNRFNLISEERVKLF